jgi:hypothetical protein
LENLAKNRFSEKQIFGNFLTQEFYTFLKSAQNSASFDTLFLHPILKKFVFNSYKDGAVFLEVNSSNKIEIVQYFKKTLFYKLFLGFQGQTKIT